MKICIECKKSETSKWFSGPMCRICYRKQPHIKEKESLSRFKKINHYNNIAKEYNLNNKDKIKAKDKIWYENNKYDIAIRKKQYKIDNRDAINIYTNNYSKNRRMEDLNYKLRCYLRSRLSHAVKNNQKVGSAIGDLGCSINKLKIHLQLKFTRNPRNQKQIMTWDNYGEWHIDHKIPLVLFDLANEEEFKNACHYTNLQPMWAKDNIKKGSKIDRISQELICH